jgi:hypothetical protein
MKQSRVRIRGTIWRDHCGGSRAWRVLLVHRLGMAAPKGKGG